MTNYVDSDTADVWFYYLKRPFFGKPKDVYLGKVDGVLIDDVPKMISELNVSAYVWPSSILSLLVKTKGYFVFPTLNQILSFLKKKTQKN